MEDRYVVIAFCGESGCGKDFIVKEALSRNPDRFHEIVSCTTRPQREYEVEGKDYYFLSVGEFNSMIAAGDMLEHAIFNNWYYGTPIKALSKDKINIGVFNLDGIRSMQENQKIDLYVYRLAVSDKERLLRQLSREKDPDVNEIIRRYSTDKQDFQFVDEVTFYKEMPNENLYDMENILQDLDNFN